MAKTQERSSVRARSSHWNRLTFLKAQEVLVILLPDDETEFWLQASQASLDAIWDNPEDDVYAKLLKE